MGDIGPIGRPGYRAPGQLDAARSEDPGDQDRRLAQAEPKLTPVQGEVVDGQGSVRLKRHRDRERQIGAQCTGIGGRGGAIVSPSDKGVSRRGNGPENDIRTNRDSGAAGVSSGPIQDGARRP